MSMFLTIVGVDRVNLTLRIHPDNISELNEVFTVELTNVTERNERIRTGAVWFCLIVMSLCKVLHLAFVC